MQQPGDWIVEGGARFVEDQVTISLTEGAGLEQSLPMSVSLTASIARMGKLIANRAPGRPPQREFLELGDEPIWKVPVLGDA